MAKNETERLIQEKVTLLASKEAVRIAKQIKKESNRLVLEEANSTAK